MVDARRDSLSQIGSLFGMGDKARPSVVEFDRSVAVYKWDASVGACSCVDLAVRRPLLQHVAAAFVPEGPVSHDYFEFQVWDSVQGLCSYIRGMLSSQAILRGIGVGSTSSTAGSAVFHFFMRDFSGMLGGVLFAMLQGSGLDSYAKQWRLFADCFNNVGYVLELLSPIFPPAFLFLACLGSIARAVTGVAAGATRAALTQHFAKAGNAADVSAKEGSQETAVTLLGMAAGMLLVHTTSGNAATVWVTFLLLTALHIYANVKAMRSLHLTSLNRPRVDILLESYSKGQEVAPVEEVAAVEPLIAPPVAEMLSWLQGRQQPVIRLGASFAELSADEQQALLAAGGQQPYFCCKHGSHVALVILAPAASKLQIFKAYAAAWRLLHPLEKGSAETELQCRDTSWMQTHWDPFLKQVRAAGWETDRLCLGESTWRVSWGSDLHHE